jgi:hypothetical protein
LGCRRYQQVSLLQHRGQSGEEGDEEGSNSEAEQDVRDLVSERDERAARRAMMKEQA